MKLCFIHFLLKGQDNFVKVINSALYCPDELQNKRIGIITQQCQVILKRITDFMCLSYLWTTFWSSYISDSLVAKVAGVTAILISSALYFRRRRIKKDSSNILTHFLVSWCRQLWGKSVSWVRSAKENVYTVRKLGTKIFHSVLERMWWFSYFTSIFEDWCNKSRHYGYVQAFFYYPEKSEILYRQLLIK